MISKKCFQNINTNKKKEHKKTKNKKKGKKGKKNDKNNKEKKENGRETSQKFYLFKDPPKRVPVLKRYFKVNPQQSKQNQKSNTKQQSKSKSKGKKVIIMSFNAIDINEFDRVVIPFESMAKTNRNNITTKNNENRGKKTKKNENNNKQKQSLNGMNIDEFETESKESSATEWSRNTVNNAIEMKGDGNRFRFWDGIYHDIEFVIFSFFSDIRELMSLRRVNKQFFQMIENSPAFLRNGIQCWFHRTSQIAVNENNSETILLCLGYGVTPRFFQNQNIMSHGSNDECKSNEKKTTLANQIFGIEKNESQRNYFNSIRAAIGNYEMISCIDTTFDLLSSDAFETFGIRKNVFNDRKFTHFMPLYLSKSHGKISAKLIEKYVLQLFDKNGPYFNKDCQCSDRNHMPLFESNEGYYGYYKRFRPKAKQLFTALFNKYAIVAVKTGSMIMRRSDLKRYLADCGSSINNNIVDQVWTQMRRYYSDKFVRLEDFMEYFECNLMNQFGGI